ncbi:MAG: glutathione S-transferase [Pseudomonadota bacterium]
MYTLIGNPKTRAFRVLWMLEELGVPYDLIPDAPNGEIASKHNPTGKIPVLMHGDVAIVDSVAAMTYLADKHGAMTHPAGSIERALQDSLTQFLNDEFDGSLWVAARHRFILPEEKRVPAVEETLKWEFKRSVTALDARVGDGPFLTGDMPTIPDMLLAHLSGWAYRFEFPKLSKSIVEVAKRMQAMESYKRADAIRNPPA